MKTSKLICSAIILILISVFISSCSMTFEKRRYRPGYHVDIITKRDQDSRSNEVKQSEIKYTEVLSFDKKTVPEVNDSTLPKLPVKLDQHTNISTPKSTKLKTTPTYNYQFKHRLQKPTKNLVRILQIKNTNGLREKKIAGWVVGGIAAGVALGSIPIFVMGSFAWIFGLVMLAIALLLAIIALCVRFIGAKGMVDEPFVYKPIDQPFVNASFIFSIITLSLSLIGFIFSFLIYPFGLVSLSILVVAALMSIVTMGLGFRALKDDKSIKTKLIIIFAFVALLLMILGMIFLFL